MKNKDFAQSFFSFFRNNKSFLTKEDVEYLASSHDFGNYTVLKESHGSPDEEYKEDGYQRYYKEFLLDLYGKKFLVSQQWYSRQSPYNLQKFAEWLIKKAKEKNFPKDKIPSEFFEGMNLPKGEAVERDNDNENAINESQNGNSQSKVHQKIFFGAPGTGKSFKVNEAVQNQQVFRTTFHPDYDYAQFVGAYKPKKEGNAITYSFVPQVFAKAYAAAWNLYFEAKGDSRFRGNDSEGHGNDSEESDIRVFLVIEEINRGNCAQIFGDIFQLLDRDGEGFSQYSIDADCDFAEWLKEDSILKTIWSEYETKVGDGKLKLPPNLNILATMNTSDQSLFPMDSAFKRRFDWEYVPINYEKSEADFIVGDASFNFKWLDFLKKVNADIYKVTQSEDKQMGEFFIKNPQITEKEFINKVMFYLWNDVCKDLYSATRPSNNYFLRDSKDTLFTFAELFSGRHKKGEEDTKPKQLIAGFMAYLKSEETEDNGENANEQGQDPMKEEQQ